MEHRVECPGCGRRVDVTMQVEGLVADRLTLTSEQIDAVAALTETFNSVVRGRTQVHDVTANALMIEKTYSADLEMQLITALDQRDTLGEHLRRIAAGEIGDPAYLYNISAADIISMVNQRVMEKRREPK